MTDNRRRCRRRLSGAPRVELRSSAVAACTELTSGQYVSRSDAAFTPDQRRSRVVQRAAAGRRGVPMTYESDCGLESAQPLKYAIKDARLITVYWAT